MGRGEGGERWRCVWGGGEVEVWGCEAGERWRCGPGDRKN